APGRVNVIGEHTDYNEGFVFPMCLELGTVVVGGRVPSGPCRLYSASKDLEFTFDLDNVKAIAEDEKGEWTSYIRGAVAKFMEGYEEETKTKLPPTSFVGVIVGNIPCGGGVSSSASLEVAVMTFVEELFNYRFEEDKKARLCQAAEREFADVPCGIMDQLISVKGKHGSALFVDCRSLETVAVPLGSGDMKVLVTNSMVKHDLHGSEYPARVRQCKESLEAIKKHFGVEKAFLRDVSKEEVEEAFKAGHMSDLAYKRALHVVTENQRTQEAMRACKNKDWTSLGRLMNESHDSLRDNYQVSCPELDALVDMARSMEGVLGSRMTGAGFGGCIVSLVRESSVDRVKEELTRGY
ncbi:hypothetical protein GUITHDRAFT_46286, partial [Guillardia theta CCMP2712]